MIIFNIKNKKKIKKLIKISNSNNLITVNNNNINITNNNNNKTNSNKNTIFNKINLKIIKNNKIYKKLILIKMKLIKSKLV